MIPTSFTGSSPPTAVVGGGFLSLANNSSPITGGNASSNNTSTSSSSSNGGVQGNNSALLGIASLILEGRALAEDEYAVARHQDVTSLAGAANAMECGRQSPKPSTSRAAASFHEHHGGSSGGGYLRRMAAISPEFMQSSSSSSSLLRGDYYSNSSSESASSSVDSNHSRWTQKLNQLRQESPSAHHHHQLAAREQKVAVECLRSSEPEYVALAINTTTSDQPHDERRGGDFEIIRRYALNRMNLYNSPASNAAATTVVGGGGPMDNYMCSLQSLASNTCLRVGTPVLSTPVTASTPKYTAYRVTPPHSTPRFPTPQHTDVSAGSASSSGSGVHSPLAWYQAAMATATPVGTNNNKDYLQQRLLAIAIPTPQTTPTNSSSNSCNSTYNSATINLLSSNVFGRRDAMATVPMAMATTPAPAAATATVTATTTPTTSRNSTPQQGPHCDQFLRKMGLAKGEASDTEEHHCDMSYVNITCTRWRAYCIKMENILARGEPICIEVYLGPVGHKILLEQWIITVNEKQPPPTMTLPSLCSAIRSQLYFSQISAWCDLIKKSDKTIYDTGRLIFTTPPTTSAAGDLATTTANVLSTSPSPATAVTNVVPSPTLSANSPPSAANSAGGGGGGGVGGNTKRRPPRLNIFYRIKPYDESSSTVCFNSKPNVHNFPNVNVSENCSVSVCLKSLPRITGGIPKVGPAAATATTTATVTAITNMPQCNATPTTATRVTGTWMMTAPKAASTPMSMCATATKPAVAEAAVVSTTTLTTNANKPTTILTMNCDNKNSKEHHQQKQQQTAVFNATYLNHGNADDYEDDDDDNDHDFQEENGGESKTAAAAEARNVPSQGGCGVGGGRGAVGDINCDAAGGGDGGGDSSNSSLSTNYGNLSHREKQLLKYRKRMLKRDKKQQQRKTNESSNNAQTNDDVALKMEQGEEEDDDDDDEEEEENDNEAGDNDKQQRERVLMSRVKANNDVNNTTKGQRPQQLPNSFINSIPSTNGQREQVQQQHQQHVKMISTGTQTTTTTTNNATNTCSSCGYEKSMICLKCNPLRNAAAAAALGDYSFVENDDDVMDAESAMSSTSASSSSACSLSSSDIIHTPRNKAELLLQAIQRTPKSNKKLKKAKDLQHQQHTKQQPAAAVAARAPPPTQSPPMSNNNNNSQHHARSSPSNNSLKSTSSTSLSSSSSLNGSMMQLQGCQVCKRQKTQHNFLQQPATLDVTSLGDCTTLATEIYSTSKQQPNGGLSADGIVGGGEPVKSENETDGRQMSTTDDCVDSAELGDVARAGNESSAAKSSADTFKDHEVMEEEYFVSSTKLTPNIERCSLATKTYYAQLHQQPPPPTNGTDTQRRLCSTPPLIEHTSENAKSQGLVMMAQFKTPTPSEQQIKSASNRQMQQQPHKQTPKPNLLQIAFSFNDGEVPANRTHNSSNHHQHHDQLNVIPSIHNPLLARRNSPKVNLTRIFCSTPPTKTSSPIPISNGGGASSSSSSSSMSGSKSADVHVTEAAAPTFSFESPSGPPPSLTVQKSNSAPTLPNSPSLSPRFIKASALYKRRSRHLSDRSDRSSLGSDEQFSDEDLDCGMYSPFATSPVKLRTRLSAVFGRKPLLGNLEESLLQRRLMPKIEVMGFKLLLGASGGFCPTQLTIPAAAYFYELKGESLSTPYLCEIRLPRKGYSVPRCGNVQATLLNPMGTVVRMFVIPYDMRDMPALHQTFVRQRILADSGQQMSSGGDSGAIDGMVQNGNIIDFGGGGDNATINANKQQQQRSPQCNSNTNSNNNNNNNSGGNMENHLGHFISAENMKSLRYSIHLRFQTSRSGRLMLHTDIRLLISRRTDCDTAAAHAKGVLEAPNELITNTVMPTNPKYSARQDQTTSSKI